ncbi:hypothetical protein AJ79_03462 [Helicocarpus griseus UAMH5409]|uniref:AB hydrolase-1 domain-containing protein n=1 Tax=Helicocarpus griseus UAMH5409 TaxID=1447875 RepID=A0A2B7XYA7_9EURO|nr:hypothetical protein AJ79_03462 [Helicocarpus griseus UAMH5409]
MPSLALLASAVLAVSGTTTATFNKIYHPENAVCVDYTIPLSVATDKALSWNGTQWSDNFGLTDFVSMAGSRPDAGFPVPITGPVDYKDDVEISGTFCSPMKGLGDVGESGGTVLLASHGLGFDKGYWNSEHKPEDYNFVQFAVSQGYAVFFYDRLGVGKSSKISGFMNQAPIQINILGQLSAALKTGRYTGDYGLPKSVVLLGHSFGSFLSNALLALEPESADGAILTGLAYNSLSNVQIEAFNLRIAAEQKEAMMREWKDLDAGYVTWDDIYGNVNNFFKAPSYSLETVEYAEKNKQPFGILEFLSISSLSFEAPNFAGPVMYIAGEYDFPVCAGYCGGGILEKPAKSFFSASRAFEAHLVPLTGHSLNFHENATDGFRLVTQFLKNNGL